MRFFDIFDRDQTFEISSFINHRQFFNAMLLQNFFRLL